MSELVWRPRNVPLSITIGCLFGGALGMVGWIFFAMGSAFAWAFLHQADLASWYQFAGKTVTTNGKIVAIEQTNCSEGSKGNSRSIMGYRYEFVDQAGVAQGGISYSTDLHEAGDTVDVEFVADKSERSRISGMRSKPFGMAVIFVLIFPMVGIGLVIGQFVSGLRRVGLLSVGMMTLGVLVDKQPTNTKINNKTVYQFTFEFVAADGQRHKAIAKTHNVEVFAGEKLSPSEQQVANQLTKGSDDNARSIVVNGELYQINDGGDLREFAQKLPAWLKEKYQPLLDKIAAPTDSSWNISSSAIIEPLIYNPRNPEKSLVLDELPFSPRIAPDGRIVVKKPASAFLVVLMPMLGIAANVAGYLLTR